LADAGSLTPCFPIAPAFRLTGGSSGFSDRSRSIFDQLDSAAKLTSTRLAEDNVLDGAFARPAPPSPPPAPLRYSAASEGAKKVMSGKRVPDYLAHPERWTRYSLEDIPETGEQENKQERMPSDNVLHLHYVSSDVSCHLLQSYFNPLHPPK
uniref:U5 small nuclear ribonucleoprotein TSSC4 n=1 Tax=Electrophorus electricus TaxID=8005 RepID=A0A4W4E2V8_ELEEL